VPPERLKHVGVSGTIFDVTDLREVRNFPWKQQDRRPAALAARPDRECEQHRPAGPFGELVEVLKSLCGGMLDLELVRVFSFTLSSNWSATSNHLYVASDHARCRSKRNARETSDLSCEIRFGSVVFGSRLSKRWNSRRSGRT